MPLRLFLGGRGGRVRSCPACEERVEPDATFCPSCYMVFRPEGAADLRQHLHGNRIPADVYLRRKMLAVDPDLGPVVPVPVEERTSPSPPAPTAAPALVPPDPSPPPAPPPAESPARPVLAPAASAPAAPAAGDRSEGKRSGARSLAEFEPPLPPPARSAEEAQSLLGWMLEHDPLIPNNLPRLEAIHASVLHGGPDPRLGYRQHVVLQVADDLALHDTQEALAAHLERLAAAYRRAALSYGRAAQGASGSVDVVLWRMASFASRLRVESWIYQSRHGAPAPLAAAARRARGGRKS